VEYERREKMSWGERSCVWYGSTIQPCQPTIGTCNVDCPKYCSNSGIVIVPDSFSKSPEKKKRRRKRSYE